MIKKQIRIIVILIFLSGVLCGCSEQYKIERMVWQADKGSRSIFLNEGEVSTYEFNSALAEFEEIIKKAPDSQHALNASFKIAQLYAIKKEFDNSRIAYDKIIATHQGRTEIQALAMFEKGQTYEKAEDWSNALIIFKKIMDDYYLTKQGIAVPLYVVRYYVQKSEPEAAYLAYEAARVHYKGIIEKHPKTKAVLLCENLIVRTLMEQKNWLGAAEYLRHLDQQYSLGVDTLLILAKLYENKLDLTEEAIKVYERIVRDFSDHKAVESIKEKIVKLKD